MKKPIPANWIIVALGLVFTVMPLCAFCNRPEPKRAQVVGGNDVATLALSLQDDDATIRLKARWRFIRLGKPAIPILVNLLDSSKSGTRCDAASALCQLRNMPRKSAVPGLIRMLNRGSPRERSAALETLGGLGADALAAVPVIQEILRAQERGKEVGINPPCCFAPSELTRIQGAGAVPFLIQALDFTYTRVEVLRALGSLGAYASAAVPEIKALTGDDVPMVKAAASFALEQIQFSEAIQGTWKLDRVEMKHDKLPFAPREGLSAEWEIRGIRWSVKNASGATSCGVLQIDPWKSTKKMHLMQSELFWQGTHFYLAYETQEGHLVVWALHDNEGAKQWLRTCVGTDVEIVRMAWKKIVQESSVRASGQVENVTPHQNVSPS